MCHIRDLSPTLNSIPATTHLLNKFLFTGEAYKEEDDGK